REPVFSTELVYACREARDRPRRGLLVHDALASRLVDRLHRAGERRLRRRLVFRGEGRMDTLQERADGARDAAIAEGALDTLAVALLGGGMIGHDKSLVDSAVSAQAERAL